MVKLRYKATIVVLGILLTVAVHSSLAQDATCPELVARALETVSQICGDLERNTVCYGNDRLEASFADTAQVTFVQPSDRAPVESLQLLQTFAMDETLGLWGVALLNIQANVPDSLPGQGVKFILYGDVKLDNAVPTNDANTGYGPMQAFYLTTTPLKTSCTQAPPDSLVIQSPQDVKVNLNVNGLDVTVGSSIALRAQPNQRMKITTLQGEVVTTYNGETQIIPAGFEASVPLGGEDGLTVEGAPEDLQVIDDEVWEVTADASGELWDEPVEVVDTDQWDSLEDYCSDPANTAICDDPDFAESAAACEQSGCFEDENIPEDDCVEDCLSPTLESACEGVNCEVGDDSTPPDETSVDEPPPDENPPPDEPPDDSPPPDDGGGGDEGG